MCSLIFLSWFFLCRLKGSNVPVEVIPAKERKTTTIRTSSRKTTKEVTRRRTTFSINYLSIFFLPSSLQTWVGNDIWTNDWDKNRLVFEESSLKWSSSLLWHKTYRLRDPSEKSTRLSLHDFFLSFFPKLEGELTYAIELDQRMNILASEVPSTSVKRTTFQLQEDDKEQQQEHLLEEARPCDYIVDWL